MSNYHTFHFLPADFASEAALMHSIPEKYPYPSDPLAVGDVAGYCEQIAGTREREVDRALERRK